MRCKFLQIVSKLAVAEGKPKKHSVTEGRYGFLNSSNRQGRESYWVFLFIFICSVFLDVYVS